MRTHTLRYHVQAAAALLAVAAVLLPVFLIDVPWPAAARDYLEHYGVGDSGAINLVSAVYLGFRFFDTLGETLVLIAAVCGTIGMLTRAGAILPEGFDASGMAHGFTGEGEAPDTPTFTIPVEKPKSHTLRTHLLEVVTGVLGPVVLVFGFYVMLYGHYSPGGGFQGGAVIASGIVFLALGKREEVTSILTQAPVLYRIESASYLLLVLMTVSGLFAGSGFLGNPFARLFDESAAFIMVLDICIGMIVGTGIGFICIAMVGRKVS